MHILFIYFRKKLVKKITASAAIENLAVKKKKKKCF